MTDWDLDSFNLESEALQSEREIWDEIASANAPLATEAEAHAEWHRNTGVPIGTPGCPQDACHADEHDNACERCGRDADLFHNEATGLALCEACDRATDEVEQLLAPEGFHERRHAEARRAETPPAPTPGTVTFKRLRNNSWGLSGPAASLHEGSRVEVTKRSGEITHATVGRVLWTGDGKAIATIRR